MTDQITHSVFFTLHHPENSPQEAAFLEESFQILSTIPGVEQFEVLKETSPKNPYRFGFAMKFKDQKTYNAYSNHPDHNKYVQERWLKEVENFQEIDHKTIRE
jgi:hypothetical protein